MHFLAILPLILYGQLPHWPRVGAEGTSSTSLKRFLTTIRSLILDLCIIHKRFDNFVEIIKSYQYRYWNPVHLISRIYQNYIISGNFPHDQFHIFKMVDHCTDVLLIGN